MVSKSGRPVCCRNFVIVDGRHGKSRVFRGFFCDVTADAQVQERDTLLRMLSESIDEIFWFVGLNPLRFIYLSPAVERIMGREAGQFYSRDDFWLQCIHEEDRQRVQEAFSGWLNGTFAEYKVEFRIVLPDGRIRWLADHGALVYDGGGRTSFATGVAKDITAEKQNKENSRRLSGQLISAQEEERKRIARELHDNVSQGLSLLTVELEQLCRHQDATSHQQDALAAMKRQLKVLSSDVHALSHQLHPEKLKHLGLVSAMRAMCRDVDRAGLRVHFADHRIPRQVHDDISLTLYRVMQEGLHNVRKHSGTSEVEADLSKVSNALILRLRDHGRGFDRSKAESAGGLGLSSMRERLSSVGGSLLIQSAPGEGTLLEARVPLSMMGSFRKDDMNNLRLLLADDHLLLLDAFKRLLEERYDVIGTAVNGLELVTSAIRLKPDIIIADVGHASSKRIGRGQACEEVSTACQNHYLDCHRRSGPRPARALFRCFRVSAEELRSRGIVRGAAGCLLWPTLCVGVCLPRCLRIAPQPAKKQSPERTLSARQRQVLQLLAEGHTMKQAAAELGVTPRTIAFTNIML